MLDRKKLFVDVKSVYRGSRARGFQESDLLDSPLVLKTPQQQSLDIETPALDQLEDQVEEAAHFFLDQPTPDLEMRSNLNPLTPFLTSSFNTSSTNTSTTSVISQVNASQQQVPLVIKQEPVDRRNISKSLHNDLQPPRYSRMESQNLYNEYPDFLLDDQPTPQSQQQTQQDSLSTPVVNPNFSGNPFTSFERLPSRSAEQFQQLMISTMPVLGQTQRSEASWVSGSLASSTTAFEDASFVDETASYSTSHGYMPEQQASIQVLSHHHHEAASLSSSQLPESVIESFQRPPSTHVLMQPHSPSDSSDMSSQVPSPACPGSRSGSFSQDSNKRKRSASDEGCRGKSGRPTKKQQLDMLCNRKKILEHQNHQLREDVAGYERACRRLKDMLYQRIREQRA